MEEWKGDLMIDIYEDLPLSEQTLIRHKYQWKGHQLFNDFGYPCEYRIMKDMEEIGRVKYYKGRKLMFYELITEGNQ